MTPNDPVLTGGAKTKTPLKPEWALEWALAVTVRSLDGPNPRWWAKTFLRLPADMWGEVRDRLTPGQRAVLDREIETHRQGEQVTEPLYRHVDPSADILTVIRDGADRILIRGQHRSGLDAAVVSLGKAESRELAGIFSKWAGPPAADAESAKDVTRAREELIATAASLATADGFDAREVARDIGAAADRLIAAARKQAQ